MRDAVRREAGVGGGEPTDQARRRAWRRRRWQEEAGEDVLLEIIESFLENVEKRMINLNQHIEGDNLDGAAKEAHDIKSMARTLGANSFAEVAFQIEKLKGQIDDKTFPIQFLAFVIFKLLSKYRKQLRHQILLSN